MIRPLFRFSGRNLPNLLVVFLENLRHQKVILKLIDLYPLCFQICSVWDFSCLQLNQIIIWWVIKTSLKSRVCKNTDGGTSKRHTVFPRIVSAKTILFELLKPRKSHIVSAFLLCNENLKSFLTRVRKLFKGGNIQGRKLFAKIWVLSFLTKWQLFSLMFFFDWKKSLFV